MDRGSAADRCSLQYSLFDAYPKLAERLPRVPLGAWPTPLDPADKLAAAAGLPFRLLVKRDDLSSAVYGGNKVRKLELLLAKALAGRYRFVVTSGGLGSNHVVATAALGALVGLGTRGLLFCQPVTAHVRRNILAGVSLGADLRWVKDYTGVVLGYLGAIGDGLVSQGKPPYILMPGGSNSLSSIGYVNAVFELVEQLPGPSAPEPAAIFVPGGTGGTAAGLLAGVALAGLETTVVAVRVVAPGLLPEAKIRDLAAATLSRLSRLDPAIARRLAETKAIRRLGEPGAGGLFELEEGYLGEAYGFATAAGRAAVEQAQRAEELKLETTYTGKTLAALLAAGAPPAGSRAREVAAFARAAASPSGQGRAWLRRAEAGHPVIFLNTYSSADPAGLAVGQEPADLVAKVPSALRWCFDRPRRDCRCGLARQCQAFCATTRAKDGWEWK